MLTPASRWQYPAKAQPVHEVALPTLDWLVQQPDPVRRPPELVGEQFSFTRLVELSEIPIDWVPQYPDPIRRPPELVHEQVAFLRLVGLSEITIDWLLQQPDPVLLPERLVPGETTLVEFGIPVPPTVPDIDFIVQHPDPLPAPPPTQTKPILAFEHEDLIPPPSWLVQHPDPVRPLGRLVPEALAFEFEHELLIPSIDWLQQLPGPIQELRRPPTQPATPELTEVPPPTVVFDWLVQHPDPVLPEKLRQGWYVRVDEMVEIPIETWLQPPSEPVLPLPPRQDWYARDFTIPEVVLDEWWQPASQPVRLPIQLVRFHGELFLIEFAVPPGVGIPFVFRECQALWEIIHSQFWESAVASSGYIPPPEYIPPASGYIEPAEPVPAPSGYIAEEDGNALWDMVR